MDAIWASIITGAISLVGTVVTVSVNSAKKSALMDYRLKELEKKQDKHNEVIERTYKLEERANILDEKMKVANHRIDDLEKKAG